MARSAGVLLSITSLPSPYGIGTIGKEARKFADFLKKSGQTIWQILPVGPTSYGDSPYQSFSTYAGNPYLIDLDTLCEEGLLTKEEVMSRDWGSNDAEVDYEKIYNNRFEVLKIAYDNFKKGDQKAFTSFKRKNSSWLKNYALYMAVKKSFDMVSWTEWPDEEIKMRDEAAVKRYERKLKDDVDFWKFVQFKFYEQWMKLKSYANSKGIQIIGDIPIYVAFDGADTWASPELFQFDEENNPVAVAGCPPDDFSATGQLWGNPLYDWKYHKKTGYAWWMQRIAYCYQLYDVLRIDHFRGFDEYWFVPYGDPTAENGHWEKGPGYELFDVMKKKLGRKKVIAEDLGFLTPSVIRLVKKTGYPGMKILQFAFDAGSDSEYLPHNYDKNCVVYTGTHDNDTTVGFLQNMPEKDKKFAKKYLGHKKDRKLCFEIIRAALSSCADTAIIPMQDYLELDSSARINTPSTLGCNWKWRMDKDALDPKLAKKIYKMAKLYGRL